MKSTDHCVRWIAILGIVALCGCSGSASSSGNPNEARIKAIETSIQEWKDLVESGTWQQYIAEGVAIEAIDEPSFQRKPERFPDFKIKQLEEKLEELKASQ